jgi:hypothetical protein
MLRPPLTPIYSYLDDDYNIVETTDVRLAFAMNRKNKIAVENYKDYRVSTVFLAVDHGYDGIPMHFETAVFKMKDGEPQFGNELWRSNVATIEEAKANHALAKQLIDENRIDDINT